LAGASDRITGEVGIQDAMAEFAALLSLLQEIAVVTLPRVSFQGGVLSVSTSR